MAQTSRWVTTERSSSSASWSLRKAACRSLSVGSESMSKPSRSPKLCRNSKTMRTLAKASPASRRPSIRRMPSGSGARSSSGRLMSSTGLRISWMISISRFFWRRRVSRSRSFCTANSFLRRSRSSLRRFPSSCFIRIMCWRRRSRS